MLRRPSASALLLCYLAACTSWHVEKGVSPVELISTEHPTAVRLTVAHGYHIVLDEPRIAVDHSVAGVVHGQPFSVAVSDVTQVAIRKVSPIKTIGLAVGIAGSIYSVLLVWLVLWDEHSPDPGGTRPL